MSLRDVSGLGQTVLGGPAIWFYYLGEEMDRFFLNDHFV